MLDCNYLLTSTGQINFVEIICLLGALISVQFTSRLYCELVDYSKSIYPNFSTLLIRSIHQSFSLFCLTVTSTSLIIHLYDIRFSGRNCLYINRLCLVFNVIMGLMMISVGICAAFWEDKLRRTPEIIEYGYLLNKYQYISNELTHPRLDATIAASIFAILSGILFLIEACTRLRLTSPNERTISFQMTRLPRLSVPI